MDVELQWFLVAQKLDRLLLRQQARVLVIQHLDRVLVTQQLDRVLVTQLGKGLVWQLRRVIVALELGKGAGY